MRARGPVPPGWEVRHSGVGNQLVAWTLGDFEAGGAPPIVALTDEMHRFRNDANLERWRLWSPGWERRREALSQELEEFRSGRGVLARAREFYRLVSSLCFAKTLHGLYAAELNSRGGEPGGAEARDWSGAIDQMVLPLPSSSSATVFMMPPDAALCVSVTQPYARKASSNRAHRGIVAVKYTTRNQRGEPVLTMRANQLIRRRPTGSPSQALLRTKTGTHSSFQSVEAHPSAKCRYYWTPTER